MDKETRTSRSYVVFQVGDNEFAFPLFEVRQVISPEDLREMAGDGEGRTGAVQYRGRAIDVVDLGRRLGIAERSRRQQSIIVLNRSASAGVLVDSAPIVTSIEGRQIRRLPPIVCSPGDPFVGVAKLGEDRLVLLLDAGLV